MGVLMLKLLGFVLQIWGSYYVDQVVGFGLE